MSDFSDFRRNILFFLSGLRNTVDRPGSRFEEPDEWRVQMLLKIEEARIRFNARTRLRSEAAVDWEKAKTEIELAILDISEQIYIREAESRPFLAAPFPSQSRDGWTMLMETIAGSPGDRVRMPVYAAVSIFRNYLAELDFSKGIQQVLELSDLKKIVPAQKVAPVQFEIVGGIIHVARSMPQLRDEDRHNTSSALDHIKHAGDDLLDHLQSSNCDPRLIDTVKNLHAQINENSNIVKIGLTNIGCSMMGHGFQDELPTAIGVMLNSYTASVSLYVSQFPEWQQFVEKAASIEIDDQDLRDIDEAARAVIEDLSAQPELAHPDVPKTIAAVRQFLQFPGASTKKAGLALLRTLENLVSSVMSYGIDFLTKTAAKTVDGASTVASKVILALLSVALASATGISEAAIKAGAPWVKQAADIVQKQIDETSK